MTKDAARVSERMPSYMHVAIYSQSTIRSNNKDIYDGFGTAKNLMTLTAISERQRTPLDEACTICSDLEQSRNLAVGNSLSNTCIILRDSLDIMAGGCTIGSTMSSGSVAVAARAPAISSMNSLSDKFWSVHPSPSKKEERFELFA